MKCIPNGLFVTRLCRTTPTRLREAGSEAVIIPESFVVLGLHRDYIGIVLGLHWDSRESNGKEHGQ